MARIVVAVVFQTWGEAVAAADELRKADYDVLIAHDVVDVYSNATFAEVYATVDPATWRDYAEYCATAGRKGAAESADAIWDDVARIVDPFRGIAESCGPMDNDHVPFVDYRRNSRWRPVLVN